MHPADVGISPRWLLGCADEAGVVAAKHQRAYSAAGLVGGKSDQALFEVTRYGMRIARAGVPGGWGDHLVSADSSIAQANPVHEGAAGGVGVAESLGVRI